MNKLQQDIADVITERSKALHIASSDVLPHVKKASQARAEHLDTVLMYLFARLPYNRPDMPAVIITPAGVRMVIQSVKGDDAVYVPVEKFDTQKFAYNPSSRVNRFENERAATTKTLVAIQALEAVEINPIEAGDQDEITAVISRWLGNVASI